MKNKGIQALLCALLCLGLLAGCGQKPASPQMQTNSVKTESYKPFKAEAEAVEPAAQAYEAQPETQAQNVSEQPTQAERHAVEVTQPQQEEENKCSLTIDCHVLTSKPDTLRPALQSSLPADGILLRQTEIVFTEGESAFDVLLRITRENKMHLEFSKTPVSNEIYVEGIANLYEFDAGEMSGWLYSINGVFQPVACSAYTLKNGDAITFVYTCDLGRDVGAYVE